MRLLEQHAEISELQVQKSSEFLPGRGTAPQVSIGDPMVLSDYLEENGTVGYKIHRHNGVRTVGDTF